MRGERVRGARRQAEKAPLCRSIVRSPANLPIVSCSSLSLSRCRLEARLAKEEEDRYLAEEAAEQERERVAAMLERERLEAETRVREQTRLAQEALAKLREMEELRASENRMLEQFRKKERQAR